MSPRQIKIGYLAITWLHIYAVAYYFNYLFFHLRQDFAFGNRENLLFAALNGLLYVPASWFGGKFAQQRGYHTALKVGFGAMALLMAIGSQCAGLFAQTMVMALWTISVCFTWAPLEALASENEPRAGLAHMVGIYNVVWSSGAAVAYFTGGALQEALGQSSLYWLPAFLHGVQLVLLFWLERRARALPNRSLQQTVNADSAPPDFARHHIQPQTAKAFLRMAWVANPFAYVAMNTVIPLIPDLASRLHLTKGLAGVVASVWMFARLFAFVLLWRWTAWHYRFGWLVGSYVAMIASFALLLLVPNLAVIVAAQMVFGLAVGLIYYSSLFYAMDVGGETQGEHGGMHEALIGIGIFGGPAVGAAALQLFPGVPAAGSHAGIWAVAALLLAGTAGILWLRPPKQPG